LANHPYLALILTVGQFEPFYTLSHAWDEEYWDDPVGMAVQILRQHFLPVYCEFLLAWRKGLTSQEITDWLWQALNAQLHAPLECLEQVIFGPPVHAWGLDWADLDPLPDDHRQMVQTLLQALGITEDTSSDHIHYACQVADVVVISLEAYPDLEPIMRALQWVLSSSGNTLVDCTDDILAEMGHEPFDWSPEDLAFLADIHGEAEMIVTSAGEGLTLLSDTPELLAQLLTNIQTLLPILPRRHHYVEPHHLASYAQQCHWAHHPAPTAECSTPIGAEIL
jgi:hypothetical protein